MAQSPIWPVGVGSQLGAQWELWTRVLGPSSHGPLHGLFGLLHSMVSGFPRVSVLREQGRNIWHFYDLPLKVTKYPFVIFCWLKQLKSPAQVQEKTLTQLLDGGSCNILKDRVG